MQNLFPRLPKTIFAFLLFLAIQTTAQPLPKGTHQKDESKVASQSFAKKQLKYVIINNAKTGFGYDILSGNRIIINQPLVPGLPGNKGFTTKEDAAKVARLVIQKINKNIMPPTITPQDLQSLKIKT